MFKESSFHIDQAHAAWNPNGSKIAGYGEKTSSFSGIEIWNPITGTIERTLSRHTLPVNSIAWSPNGNKIVSGSADNTVKIWDTTT